MNRREALKRVALILGGAVSAPVMNAVLSGCQTKETETPFIPQTLSAEQNEIVTVISEMIIPETETPGAKAARINEFIDLLLTEWLKDKDRNRFLSGFAELDERSQQSFGNRFLDISTEEKTKLLTELDSKAIEKRRAGEREIPFIGMMKEMTLVGYYTSEIGATQELNYDPSPGFYNGCMPFEEVGRTLV